MCSSLLRLTIESSAFPLQVVKCPCHGSYLLNHKGQRNHPVGHLCPLVGLLVEQAAVASSPILVLQGGSSMSNANSSSESADDLPTYQKVLGCLSTIALFTLLTGSGWFIWTTCTAPSDTVQSTPTPVAVPETDRTKEMLDMLAQYCPGLIQAYANMTEQGYDHSDLVTAVANEYSLTPNEANDLLKYCAQWGRAIIENAR